MKAYRRFWTQHDGRCKRRRTVTFFVETLSGVVFQDRSLRRAMMKAEAFEEARAAMRS